MPLPDTIKLSLEKTSHFTKERVLVLFSIIGCAISSSPAHADWVK